MFFIIKGARIKFSRPVETDSVVCERFPNT